MTGNTLEQDIIELYSDNPSSIYSINQIAKKLGKTYPYINKKVVSLIKSKIFKKTIVGRSHLCSLNLRNDETINILALTEIKRKKKNLNENNNARLLEYCVKLAKTPGLLCILKHSDNLIIVLDSENSKQTLQKSIIHQMMKGFLPKVITKYELQSLLKEKIAIHHEKIIISGFEKYYEIIGEIEDELRIRYSKIGL